MTNSSSDQSEWHLAVYEEAVNPVEVSFRWSESVDSMGIDQGGIAVMLDAPDESSSGYLITRRTLQSEIRLWQISNGNNPDNPITAIPLQARPRPGDEFRIRITSDMTGNHFTVFINGQQDATVTDTDKFIDPALHANLYSGVMLAGGRANNVDNFKVLLSSGTTAVENSPESLLPSEFSLSRNYPNPFNPQTQFEYTVPHSAHISIAIYNLLGQKVRILVSGVQAAGTYRAQWDGLSGSNRAVTSGIYLLRLSSDGFVATRRMMLTR